MKMNEIPTDGRVADESFFVLQHRVDGHLLAVLRGDDGDGRLLVGGDGRHLLHDLDLLVLVVDPRERVELHRLNEAARLQRDDDFEDFFFRPAIVPTKKAVLLCARASRVQNSPGEIVGRDWVRVGLLDKLEHLLGRQRNNLELLVFNRH